MIFLSFNTFTFSFAINKAFLSSELADFIFLMIISLCFRFCYK
jgi:hypothetical protein